MCLVAPRNGRAQRSVGTVGKPSSCFAHTTTLSPSHTPHTTHVHSSNTRHNTTRLNASPWLPQRPFQHVAAPLERPRLSRQSLSPAAIPGPKHVSLLAVFPAFFSCPAVLSRGCNPDDDVAGSVSRSRAGWSWSPSHLMAMAISAAVQARGCAGASVSQMAARGSRRSSKTPARLETCTSLYLRFPFARMTSSNGLWPLLPSACSLAQPHACPPALPHFKSCSSRVLVTDCLQLGATRPRRVHVQELCLPAMCAQDPVKGTTTLSV